MATRRERLRAQTTQEIKDVARRQMTETGSGAISLRAVAREMGMTAGALYTYYATRDDLVTALITDAYTELAETLETARARGGGDLGDDPAGAVLAVGHAYRTWALAHPAEFRLLFGDPIPGYRAPEQGPTVTAARRAGAVWLNLVASAWHQGGPRQPAGQAPGSGQNPLSWSDFQPGIAAWARQTHPDLPPDAVAYHLRALGRLHGLLTLEVHDYLRALLPDATPLYEAELRTILTDLGLTAP